MTQDTVAEHGREPSVVALGRALGRSELDKGLSLEEKKTVLSANKKDNYKQAVRISKLLEKDGFKITPI